MNPGIYRIFRVRPGFYTLYHYDRMVVKESNFEQMRYMARLCWKPLLDFDW